LFGHPVAAGAVDQHLEMLGPAGGAYRRPS
jgi:hypothetical protein